MTANQIILLFDVKRGYNSKIHTGTLQQDLKNLCFVQRLIEANGHDGNSFDYILTSKGRKLVETLEAVAELI